MAELIGTFTLVFVGAGAGALAGPEWSGGGLVAVALAHGLAIMTAIYAWGAVSGCHINPAVTFGLAITGKTDWGTAIVYWVAQFAGGAAAGFLLAWALAGIPEFTNETGQLVSLGETKGVLTPMKDAEGKETGDAVKTIVVEAVMTFFLITAVFGSAVAGRNGNAIGLAIGMVVAMDICAGGFLTGASMNPARTFGPALAMGDLSYLWMYIVGPLAGGGAAALLYENLFLKD